MPHRFYGVRQGFQPGVYEDHELCLQQVKGFSKHECKGFSTYHDSTKYLGENFGEESVFMLVSPKPWWTRHDFCVA